MGILFGLLAAFFWGTGDFLITHLTRHTGTAKALLYVQALSLLSWLVLLIMYFDTASTALGNAGYNIWLIAIATGVLHVAGLALTYRAFEIGTLSLVSPIASGFAIVTAVLSFFTGEVLPVTALAGVLCLIAGVTLATRTPAGEAGTAAAKKVSLRGVPEALGSALAFGAMFWMFYRYVQPQLGYIWPLIILKSMAAGSSLISVASSSRKTDAAATKIPRSAWRVVGLLALGAALTDTLAWLAFIWGTNNDMLATVVTALASLFSVVTILLAWLLLRERLAKHQWAGVAIILFGVLLVSLFEK